MPKWIYETLFEMYYLLKIPGVASISRVSKILNWNAPVLHMYGNLSAHKTRHKAETQTAVQKAVRCFCHGHSISFYNLWKVFKSPETRVWSTKHQLPVGDAGDPRWTQGFSLPWWWYVFITVPCRLSGPRLLTWEVAELRSLMCDEPLACREQLGSLFK